MAQFFGTNGIRGIFPDDITLEFIHDMTLAIATYFEKGPILVGHDGRRSSHVISKIVCAALNYTGLDCNKAGLIPTPCLEYAVKEREYMGGIMVTASHNPPQYNGIKPIASDGVEISREDELVVEDIFLQKRWTAGEKYGTVGCDDDVIPAYVKAIATHVDIKKIQAKNFSIVLDIGNGAQAVAAPMLAEMLGCKTILINQNIDGEFPGRGPEPTPQNLAGLSDAVLLNNADLGIAFDGDGDRSIFCDEKGTIMTGDKSALILAKHLLMKNPSSKIVTCINSGSSIEELAAEYKSQVIRTKVGSVEVSRRMVTEGALVGFEENGGFMFGTHNQVRDGAMTLALVLDRIACSGKSLSNLSLKVPQSFTAKDKVRCDPQQAKFIIEQLAKEFPRVDTTEGIKITTGPKSWVMIRPSGTEPIVRVYAEGQSQDELDALIFEYLQKIKSIFADNTFKTKD